MKKALFSTLFIYLFIYNCNAQLQGSYWKLGRRSGLDFKSGNMLLNLNDTCLEGLDYSSSTVCDNRGNLLFYTNAIKLYNRLDRVMPNGSNFNHGTYGDSYINNGYLPIYNGATFVPFIGDTNKYYMFYENLEFQEVSGYDLLPNRLQYLVVDKTLDGGLGDVVYKDSCIVCGSDSLAKGNIFAIRHGNGKDWWLLARKFRSSLFYKVLIDSNGVHKADTQSIGTPLLANIVFFCSTSASINGDKLVYMYNAADSLYPGRVEFFDFDRCTGKISNQVCHNHNTYLDSLTLLSGCLSPNGRYYYTADYDRVLQMDMQSPNLIASKIVIATADNTPTPSPSHFNHLKLAPDGKIYVSFYGGNYYMSVINNPDNAGAACNFIYKQLYFGGLTGGKIHTADGALPNNPNYTLGKIDCGVGMGEELAVGSGHLTVYPNPCTDKLLVIGNKLLVNTIEVMDVLGRVVFQQINKSLTQQFQIDVSKLPIGNYFIKAIDTKGNVLNGKFVKE